ncbi:MAG: hypothetical protein C0467_19980 [Planctomycetaceae bacterium]|nr:hypothetical protein [Planctomycetaceae bacterium]
MGLTATPPLSDCAEVVYEKSFAELIGTVLATPVVESASTGVRWTPDIQHADLSDASLDVLARAASRNACITDYVVSLRAEGRASHILVFAISITHAKELTERFGKLGIPAQVLHSKLPQADQEQALEAFRKHKVDVLVNVAMLAEGFDFPPIDAVVLARPCLSRVLLTQMIGRGARKAPGKDSFIVVDIQDDLTRYENLLVRAADVVPAAGIPALRSRTYRPPVEHSEPKDQPRFENYTISSYGTLPFALGQTFGVEIELTTKTGVPWCDPAWESTALGIIAKLKEHVSGPVHSHPLKNKGGPVTHWRVVHDSSAGWEVVSPILVDAPGFDELQRACKAISELVESSNGTLVVNHRTGLHVTLATQLNTEERLKSFVRLVQRLEPGLFTLVAPSRLYEFNPTTQSYSRRQGNQYCRPLRKLGDPAAIDLNRFVRDYENRYHSVNLIKSKDPVPLLEVRMHHGTHEFNKIALWVSLWMQIFNTARYRWSGPAWSGLVMPGRNNKISLAQADREDIVTLLKQEGIATTPGFAALLRRNRAELRTSWEAVVPNRVGRWATAGWYVDEPWAGSLNIESNPPLQWSAGEMKCFEDLVRAGGVVETSGLSARLRRASVLACARDGNTVVAVAGMKNPLPSYRSRIALMAGFELAPERFPHELGWFYVHPDYRGRGLSELLANECLAAGPSNGVFATAHATNEPIKQTLLSCGFHQVGGAYPSASGRGKLVLFVREAPSATPGRDSRVAHKAVGASGSMARREHDSTSRLRVL